MRPRLTAWAFRCLWALALLGAWLPLAAQQPSNPAKQLSVYTPQGSYTVPVLDRTTIASGVGAASSTGSEYVEAASLLGPLGSTTAKPDGHKFKITFNGRQAEFNQDTTKAKVRGKNLVLNAKFLIEDGHGLIPLNSVASIMGQLMGQQLEFRNNARRLFLGNVARFTVAVQHAAPGKLVIASPVPINPFIATEPGRLRLVFRREPVIGVTGGGATGGGATGGGAASELRFTDALIPSATYSESNGVAELTVNGTVALQAAFDEGRRSITVTALPPPTRAPAPLPAPSAAQTPPPAPQNPPPAIPGPPPFFVLIDAAHGGEDHGAALSSSLLEKDAVLAFARRLHRELELRGIPSRLLRDSDLALTADQRAWAANASGAALYLAAHMTTAGTGVHLYTALLASVAKAAALVPWDTAQAAFLPASHSAADAIAIELLKHDVPVVLLPAPVPPLKHIAEPAIAVEIAPLRRNSVDDLSAAAYQQTLCAAIAAGLAEWRSHLRQETAR